MQNSTEDQFEQEDLDLPKIQERKILASPENLLLISHFFSAWGDRMWMFAVGLYLVELTPNSLRLTAIYGLVVAFTLVMFGSSVGHWVDANARLKVVRVSLIVQNVLVCASALVILIILYRKPGHPVVLRVCEGSIIVLGSMANLASQASTIAIERDWVIVISGDDQNILADVNAKMRRIDLSCAILAPIAVGLIMTLGSNVAGIIFICGWNILSFFAEYNLLVRVYRHVPRLATKGSALDKQDNQGSVESVHGQDEFSKIIDEDVNLIERKLEFTCCQNIVSKISGFLGGWRVYFKQNVAMAGTSLACLYLTVLGFSSVTTGYVYTQRLSGAVVSVCYGVGSVFGIVGTFLFPRIRRRCGLVKTGIVAFWCQWSLLFLCVISIWTPGSPSDLYSKHNHLWERKISNSIHSNRQLNSTKNVELIQGMTLVPTTRLTARDNGTNYDKTSKEEFSYVSVSLLLAGLILSRAGLWMTDLTVTQLLQENVRERERGVVSGTQSAFNAVLDLTHYILTIILPKPNQFGYLTLVSFAAVTIGYIIYIVFYFLKSKELRSKQRDIISVPSSEWNKSSKSNVDELERRGLADLDDDEEEINGGTLTVRDSAFDDIDIL